uniref:Putative secreted protein n=1 Tax=Ixodes ricinus TaxID=34613 RepID=A0A6B0UCJ0_IXORI
MVLLYSMLCPVFTWTAAKVTSARSLLLKMPLLHMQLVHRPKLLTLACNLCRSPCYGEAEHILSVLKLYIKAAQYFCCF